MLVLHTVLLLVKSWEGNCSWPLSATTPFLYNYAYSVSSECVCRVGFGGRWFWGCASPPFPSKIIITCICLYYVYYIVFDFVTYYDVIQKVGPHP